MSTRSRSRRQASRPLAPATVTSESETHGIGCIFYLTWYSKGKYASPLNDDNTFRLLVVNHGIPAPRHGSRSPTQPHTACRVTCPASTPSASTFTTISPRACSCEERDDKGLHAFPSNITRDEPPITRDYAPSLLTLQRRSLTADEAMIPLSSPWNVGSVLAPPRR